MKFVKHYRKLLTLMSKKTKKRGLFSIRGHHLYGEPLDSKSIIIDLGSHLGQFSSEISEVFGCQCYAVEALPSLYTKIIETPLIKKFNYAINNQTSLIELCVTENPESNHINSLLSKSFTNVITVSGITLKDFMMQQNIQEIDLLKVDIEGAEIELFNSISDDTFIKIRQITVEFHDFKFPHKAEIESIKNRLKQLGFICIIFSRVNHGDVLFINTKQCQISFLDYFYIRYLAKYLRGSIRIIYRFFYQNFLKF